MPENNNDEEDFDELDDSLPTLRLVGRFAEMLVRINWFNHVGERLTPDVQDAAQNYLDQLGFPGATCAPVENWEQAVASLETNDWNSPAWEVEEQLTASLFQQALEYVDEEALEMALTHVTAQATEHITDGVLRAAERWAVQEDEMMHVAVGQATQCCYQAALVIAAGDEGDHAFALKFRLFETGYWPLGIMGNTLNIF